MRFWSERGLKPDPERIKMRAPRKRKDLGSRSATPRSQKKVESNSEVLLQNDFPREIVHAWHEQLALLSKTKKVPEARNAFQDWLKDLVGHNRIALQALWRSYNSPQDRLARRRVTEAQSALSYVLGFHLNNVQRHCEIFKRLTRLHRKSTAAAHLLDIGCGAGAWAQAALHHVRKHANSSNLQIDLLDRSRFLLDAAEIGLKSLEANTQIRKFRTSLSDELTAQVLKKILDKCKKNVTPLWVGMSYLWNELRSQPHRQNFLWRWLSQQVDNSVPLLLFFSEPGREAEARQAQQFRHRMYQNGFSVLYPCPSSFQCPMLQTPENWCYSEVPDHQLREWQPVAKILGLKRQVLASAYYVFANPAARDFYNLTDQDCAVVVGRPIQDSRITLLACDGQSLLRSHSQTTTALRGSRLPLTNGSPP